MAPAASTTDVCPNRPAHPALAVRHVQVTPAAKRARQPAGRAERNRARGRNARRGPRYKYRKSPPCDGRARTALRRTHAPFIQTRCARTRTQPDQEARARTHTQTHTHTRARAHTRTHTHARAHTHKHPRTRIGTHGGARDRANQRAHSSWPRDMHVMNSIGGCMYMCCDGGRATRANGPKCMRGWVGVVRTPWVSLDYPSSTPL